MWLDEELALTVPKYETPRMHTPAESVVIGGSSMGIHALASPGGFQMVGRLAVPIYSPQPSNPAFEGNPALLRSGDRLVLPACSSEEFEGFRAASDAGAYEYEIRPGSVRTQEGEIVWT